jgi:hypothetical protein
MAPRWGPAKPARRIVISLKKSPKGGEPVSITAARRKSALATGVRPSVPDPISSKSDELWSWARVPAEKKDSGFASVW